VPLDHFSGKKGRRGGPIFIGSAPTDRPAIDPAEAGPVGNLARRIGSLWKFDRDVSGQIILG